MELCSAIISKGKTPFRSPWFQGQGLVKAGSLPRQYGSYLASQSKTNEQKLLIVWLSTLFHFSFFFLRFLFTFLEYRKTTVPSEFQMKVLYTSNKRDEFIWILRVKVTYTVDLVERRFFKKSEAITPFVLLLIISKLEWYIRNYIFSNSRNSECTALTSLT